ncbi:MAG: hypothetical protein RDU20_19065, partial [Desulfomonilaceae bacterium]|nr:hypothetical protein [Desulfomonilaceae bacterium]
ERSVGALRNRVTITAKFKPRHYNTTIMLRDQLWRTHVERVSFRMHRKYSVNRGSVPTLMPQ